MNLLIRSHQCTPPTPAAQSAQATDRLLLVANEWQYASLDKPAIIKKLQEDATKKGAGPGQLTATTTDAGEPYPVEATGCCRTSTATVCTPPSLPHCQGWWEENGPR
jgi:hypothetical protein